MTTEGKVSPLPWRESETDSWAALDANGDHVFSCRFAKLTPRIVRAVNAHDRLVEAIELILHSFDDGPPSFQGVRLDDACKKAQELLSALAAAKEGK